MFPAVRMKDGSGTTKSVQPPPPSPSRGRLLILAIDVGSSSVRCAAYDRDERTAVASASRSRKSIHPGTGRVNILLVPDVGGGGDGSSNLWDVIDECVDDVLEQLAATTQQQQPEYKVVAIGFSTFVMNLIGVDRHGVPVGVEATLSYRCASPEVTAEVEHLKRYVPVIRPQ